MTQKTRRSDQIPGKITEDQIVQPGDYWIKVVHKGQMLRIVDLEGQQAVDFLCYNSKDTSERYNAPDTMKYAGNIYVTKGVVLYSDMGNPIYIVTEDTCGYHDTVAGCCSAESNLHRYGVANTENCRDTFLRGLKSIGMDKKDIVPNVNFFMNVPVKEGGSVGIVDGISEPGDYVDLRAEMDALTLISNCPQRHNPCSGFNPSPVRLVIWESE